MKTVTRCPKNRDENGISVDSFVTVFVTSLFYHSHTKSGGSDDAL